MSIVKLLNKNLNSFLRINHQNISFPIKIFFDVATKKNNGIRYYHPSKTSENSLIIGQFKLIKINNFIFDFFYY